MPPRTDGERLAILETEMKALKETLGEMKDTLNHVHAALLQAKGAKWAVCGLAGLGGAITTAAIEIARVVYHH